MVDQKKWTTTEIVIDFTWIEQRRDRRNPPTGLWFLTVSIYKLYIAFIGVFKCVFACVFVCLFVLALLLFGFHFVVACVVLYCMYVSFLGICNSLDFDWFSNVIKSSTIYAHDDDGIVFVAFVFNEGVNCLVGFCCYYHYICIIFICHAFYRVPVMLFIKRRIKENGDFSLAWRD